MKKLWLFWAVCVSAFIVAGVSVAADSDDEGEKFHMREVSLTPYPGVGSWLDWALAGLALPGGTRANYSVLDLSGEWQGRFVAREATFPDPTRADEFAVEVDADVIVPARKLVWTFGVGSDDGFLLEIEGGSFSAIGEQGGGYGFTTSLGNKLMYDSERPHAESYGVFTFDGPGKHRIHLVMFDNLGEASLEFFHAPGNRSANFASAPYTLVNGGKKDSLRVLRHRRGEHGDH